MRSKKIFMMLLTGCIAASLLFGCNKLTAKDANQVNIREEDAKESDTQKKVLTFFSSMDAASLDAKCYQQMIDEYNKENANVTVTVEGIATGDGYNEYLAERLDKGEGDDVFIVNADSVKAFYNKGYFYDMSGFSVYGSLNDAAKVQSMIGDISYCIPLSMSAYCMFVNTDVLAQYHLETPNNLEEFLHCCETIKAGGGTPLSLNRWYAMTVPAMANGLYKIYGSDNVESIIGSLNTGEAQIGDYMLEGFEVVEQFIDNGWYGDNLTTDIVDTLKAGSQDIPDFVNGRTAFMFSTISATETLSKNNTNFVATGVPIPGGMVVLPAINIRMCINADSGNLDEAKEFVEYLTTNKAKTGMKKDPYSMPAYTGSEYECPKPLTEVYKVYQNNIQIPIEDMKLSFTYWDTIRVLCIKMFDGSSAQDAVDNYNQIQKEQIQAAK